MKYYLTKKHDLSKLFDLIQFDYQLLAADFLFFQFCQQVIQS